MVICFNNSSESSGGRKKSLGVIAATNVTKVELGQELREFPRPWNDIFGRQIDFESNNTRIVIYLLQNLGFTI